MVIPGVDADAEWSMWPGARTAGLGGPCGRMKRKKMRHSVIAALVIMRRVICGFAMLGLRRGTGSWGEAMSPSVRSRGQLALMNKG